MNNSGRAHRARRTPTAVRRARAMAWHYPLSCLESFFSLPLGSGSLAFFTIVSTSFVVRSHCGPGYQDRPMCPKRNLSEP